MAEFLDKTDTTDKTSPLKRLQASVGTLLRSLSESAAEACVHRQVAKLQHIGRLAIEGEVDTPPTAARPYRSVTKLEPGMVLQTQLWTQINSDLDGKVHYIERVVIAPGGKFTVSSGRSLDTLQVNHNSHVLSPDQPDHDIGTTALALADMVTAAKQLRIQIQQ